MDEKKHVVNFAIDMGTIAVISPVNSFNIKDHTCMQASQA